MNMFTLATTFFGTFALSVSFHYALVKLERKREWLRSQSAQR
jgi:hypothetical protein